MSGEYSVHLSTGLTVVALVFDADRTKIWNGSAFVSISGVADANYADGAVSCTEVTTSDGTGTGRYVGDRPSEISTAAQYVVEFYSGTPSVGDQNLAVMVDEYGTTSMSFTSTDSSFTTLKVTIADFLGWGRNTEGAGSSWNTETIARLSDIIKTGIERVLYPALPNKSGGAHQWSFLLDDEILRTSKPYETGTIACSSGVVTLTDGTFPSWAAQGELVVDGTRYVVSSRDDDDQITLDDTSVDIDSGTFYSLQRYIYDLPSDFDAPKGKFVYHADAALGYPPLRWCSVQEVRERRRRYTVTTDYPRRIARRPKTFVTATGQRWEALLEPTPDDVYPFHYQYKLQAALDPSSNVYLRGGPMIARVVEESCLAVAEQRYREDGSREHTELFHQLLAAAIEEDRVNGSIGDLGQDRGGELYHETDELSLIPTLTYNSVDVDDL